nr:hypothetical protein [uncultured bacterium]AUH21251.1 hypothetical protein [uncultured bacterium]AUH21256.1 hypothetical protein [uncultured bacterium]
MVIAQIKMEDEDFKDYKVHLADIEEKAGALQNRREVKRFAQKLISKTFTIEEENGDRTLSWFSSILRLKNESALLVRFDPALKPYLLQLQQNFTKALLSILIKFRHKYTSQIYMLLKSRISKKLDIKVEELANILNVPKSYRKNFTDFWKRVLEPALKEIDKISDLKITKIEKIKYPYSRKIERLKIKVEVKQPKEQETKQYIEHNKHEELEARLNAQYKNKSVKGEDGLNWYVKHIKVINAKEVEITLTDLTKEAQIIKPIDELDKIF